MFLTEVVNKHLNSLSKEFPKSTPLEVFIRYVDIVIRNMV